MEEKPDGLGTQVPERRIQPRYAVDERATLLLLNQGLSVVGQIVELSLGGCRLRAPREVRLRPLARVEVTFKVNGIAFRLSGITQWTDGRQLVGIRFGEMTPRRRDELSELLGEIEAEVAAKAAQAEADGVAGENMETEQLRRPPAPMISPPVAKVAVETPLEVEIQGQGSTPVPGANSAPRERRAQARHSVDSQAKIFLVDVASRSAGRIIDVSIGGCRIHTNERFPVGIYRRVEVEFVLDGLPFRLGGVTQSLHDRQTVGIRFIDLSERKREQLTMLVEEIDQVQDERSTSGSGEEG